MYIKLQINLASLLLIVAAIVVIGSNLYGLNQIRDLRNTEVLTREINRAVLDLSVLVSEFHSRRSPRVVKQFENRMRSLNEVLQQFNTALPEHRNLVSSMFLKASILQETFNDMGRLDPTNALSPKQKERAQRVLMHTVLSSSQSLAALSSRLSRSFALRIDQIENGVLIGNLVAGAIFMVIVFGLYAGFLVSVLRPLLRLRDSIMQMASPAQQDEAEKTEARNELEELSREFSRRHEALQKAEKVLQERALDLERSNQELEQFAYVASHDLQEPLRAVASYAQLLQKRMSDKLDEKGEKYVQGLVDGSMRMQRLIEAILAFSRITTKGEKLLKVNCDHVLQDAMENLERKIEENDAVIEPDILPEVMGDRIQLISLFQNLLGNAIKFRSEAAPRIRIVVERDGDFWRFAFVDNGIGMEMEYADRVFKIFQRLHNRTEYPGEGVGLSFCKRIVERHGGHIWLQSQLGEGTTIFFTLKKAPNE